MAVSPAWRRHWSGAVAVRAVALLVAALLVAACSDSGDDAAPTTTPAGGEAAPTTTPRGDEANTPSTTATSDPEPSGTLPGTDGAASAEAASCGPGGSVRQVVLTAGSDGLVPSDPDGGTPVDLDLGQGELDDEAWAALTGALTRDARTVRITLPPGAGPHPVLLEFHGYGGDAAQQTAYSRFAQVAAPDGYVVIAIDGRDRFRRWELVSTDPDPAAVGRSDVAVVDAVLDVLLDPLCADRDAIHAAGMSNGSVFAAVYACHSRHDIAAVGSVAFTTGTAGCDDDRQIPTLAIHGTTDSVVPYQGRDVPLIRTVLGWALEPADDAMAAKAELNGCDGFQDEVIPPDVTRRSWLDCDAETVFYRVDGGGHGWPGPGQPPSGFGRTTTTIDATELIVAFFDRN